MHSRRFVRIASKPSSNQDSLSSPCSATHVPEILASDIYKQFNSEQPPADMCHSWRGTPEKPEAAFKCDLKTIRQKGGCLRCRLKNRKCDVERPCGNCMIVLDPNEWMDCVCLSSPEWDIFQKLVLKYDLDVKAILERNPSMLNRDSEWDGKPFPWTTRELAEIFANSIQTALKIPFSLSVEIFMSTAFEKLLSTIIGPNLSSHFRILVLTSVILHTEGNEVGRGGYSGDELRSLRAHSGICILDHLQKALSKTGLKQAGNSTETEVLFHVLLGTLIALGYSETKCDKARLKEECALRPEDAADVGFENRTERLIRIIANYLLVVGDCAGLFTENFNRLQFLEEAHIGFAKKSPDSRQYQKCQSCLAVGPLGDECAICTFTTLNDPEVVSSGADNGVVAIPAYEEYEEPTRPELTGPEPTGPMPTGPEQPSRQPASVHAEWHHGGNLWQCPRCDQFNLPIYGSKCSVCGW